MLGHVRDVGMALQPIVRLLLLRRVRRHEVEHLVARGDAARPGTNATSTCSTASHRQHRFAKAMHVSPFLGMDHDYVMSWSAPEEHLSLHLGNRRGEREDLRRVTVAAPSRNRRPATLGAPRVATPVVDLRGVSAGIYRQALALWRKRRPVPSSPRRPADVRTSDRVPSASRVTDSIVPSRGVAARRARRERRWSRGRSSARSCREPVTARSS